NGTADYLGDNGQAIQAAINGPHGLAVDASGNVYFANTTNSIYSHDVIRKIGTSGVITTYAGATDAGTHNGTNISNIAFVAGIQGMAFDSNGNLLVAAAMSILRIAPNGNVTTLPGTASITSRVAGGPGGVVYYATNSANANAGGLS